MAGCTGADENGLNAAACILIGIVFNILVAAASNSAELYPPEEETEPYLPSATDCRGEPLIEGKGVRALQYLQEAIEL